MASSFSPRGKGLGDVPTATMSLPGVTWACRHPPHLLHGQEIVFSSQNLPQKTPKPKSAHLDISEAEMSLAARSRGWQIRGVPQTLAGMSLGGNREHVPRKGSEAAGVAAPSTGPWTQLQAQDKWELHVLPACPPGPGCSGTWD